MGDMHAPTIPTSNVADSHGGLSHGKTVSMRAYCWLDAWQFGGGSPKNTGEARSCERLGSELTFQHVTLTRCAAWSASSCGTTFSRLACNVCSPAVAEAWPPSDTFTCARFLIG